MRYSKPVNYEECSLNEKAFGRMRDEKLIYLKKMYHSFFNKPSYRYRTPEEKGNRREQANKGDSSEASRRASDNVRGVQSALQSPFRDFVPSVPEDQSSANRDSKWSKPFSEENDRIREEREEQETGEPESLLAKRKIHIPVTCSGFWSSGTGNHGYVFQGLIDYFEYLNETEGLIFWKGLREGSDKFPNEHDFLILIRYNLRLGILVETAN